MVNFDYTFLIVFSDGRGQLGVASFTLGVSVTTSWHVSTIVVLHIFTHCPLADAWKSARKSFWMVMFVIFCENHTWMNGNNLESTLVQVMAWCRQATSHYLSQCWHRSISPYDVTRPQLVNSLSFRRCGFDLKCENFKCVVMSSFTNISSAIAFR